MQTLMELTDLLLSENKTITLSYGKGINIDVDSKYIPIGYTRHYHTKVPNSFGAGYTTSPSFMKRQEIRAYPAVKKYVIDYL